MEFSKDESESDNAALSDQNSDGILPITQIVAQHHIKQVGNDNWQMDHDMLLLEL